MITRLPYISIIIPVHNEGTRIRQCVYKVVNHCEKYFKNCNYEIVLVENGSTDDTMPIARALSTNFATVKAIQVDHRSKAHAVRFGMLMAKGAYRYMCDVDLSTPIDALHDFIVMASNGWDIIIGSREHPSAQVQTSFKRWFIGRTFHALALGFTGLNYSDTQCGFKMFHRKAAEDIFSRTECVSMAFDVEALYLAGLLGYHCTEIPVEWKNDNDSRVRMVRDAWAMLKDISRIRKIHANERPLSLPGVPRADVVTLVTGVNLNEKSKLDPTHIPTKNRA